MFLIISVLSSTEMNFRIRNFAGPYFPIFRLDMEICSINLLIQSRYRKKRTKKSQKTDTFFKQWSSVDKAVEYH